MPPDLLDLGQEGVEIFIPIILDSMTSKGSPHRVTVYSERSDAGGTWVRVDHCGTDCELYVKGWILSPKVTVADLYKGFESIYNGDADTDAVAADLSNHRQAMALLEDAGLCREAAAGILSEQKIRDAICRAYLGLLGDPANWIGPVPSDVVVYLSTVEPSGEVKS
jgi:hypothetical protein